MKKQTITDLYNEIKDVENNSHYLSLLTELMEANKKIKEQKEVINYLLKKIDTFIKNQK